MKKSLLILLIVIVIVGGLTLLRARRRAGETPPEVGPAVPAPVSNALDSLNDVLFDSLDKEANLIFEELNDTSLTDSGSETVNLNITE